MTRSSSILSSKSLFPIGMRLLWPKTTRKPDGERAAFRLLTEVRSRPDSDPERRP